MLKRLETQARWAALLLYSSWLATVTLCIPVFQDEPKTMAALLPGLLVAIHTKRYLSRHLASNHGPSEGDHLFPTLGAANWISLVRAAAVVVLAGFLPLALQTTEPADFRAPGWAAGILYLGISLADLLDGFAARRQNRETELGKGLDIETDAAGLLVASLVAVAFSRLPVIYLMVGLVYYPFILGIRMRQKKGLPVVALRSRPYARIIAGCQMGLVGMALLPIFHPAFTTAAAYIFMTPLLLGFLRDWLVVSCRIKTDRDQQAGVDLRLKALMLEAPLVLRLIILAGGLKILTVSGNYNISPAWQLALGLCCLLAAAGFIGRTAGLLLVLLLGCDTSPLGLSFISLTLFCAAAALLLSGTGTMSLWAPEERILYRRRKNRSAMDSDAL